MTVAICGAGGFIGGHLVAELRRRNVGAIRAVDIKPVDQWSQRFDDVENLELDLRDPASCQRVCRGASRVYNFAADMGGMGFIELNRAACMISVLINTQLLVAARDREVPHYFFASSACVYKSDKQDRPDAPALKEEDAYPAMPEDGYGWEKLFSERMCRHFAEDFGMGVRVARLHNVYGPQGTWCGGREKAPAAICRKVIEAKHAETGRIEIWGDGSRTRSFMWIGDCIEGVLRVVDLPVEEPVNLGSTEKVTINELVDTVESIAAVKLNRAYHLDAPQGVFGRNSDNTRLRAYTGGWEPATPLRDGLRHTYAWIEEQFLESLTRG
jgi:nucleoside-diphosphate-sugar epimerase